MNSHSPATSHPFLARRQFLQFTLTAAAASLCPSIAFSAEKISPAFRPRNKQPALVRGAFFYPPKGLVDAGRNEDSWAPHQWHTWPGNQFRPEEQQARFSSKVEAMAKGLDLDIRLEADPIYTNAGVQEFINRAQAEKPAALLLFNFWNSYSPKVRTILDAWDGPVILYHPVGANHQLPPDYFRTAPSTQYIHSIENWDALERGLRAVHAKNRMRQSKLLRVSGRVEREENALEEWFGMPIQTVPASLFNTIFDDLELDAGMKHFARSIRRGARKVSAVSDDAFLDAARAHASVQRIMEMHEADAITIECLFLKHRKPCLSFATNNGNLVPCGCENHLDATLTLMLGANMFGRGGFQHNPEFDTEQNLYFGAHCTCATRLQGPQAKPATYDVRPFFHQMPKTPALDVQWPADQAVTLCKYQSGKPVLDAWRGKVVHSPGTPPTGGCATRVLVKLEGVSDVCSVYSGPHPVLYCGDFTAHLKVFSKLYGIEIRTNV